ncbi:YfbU family protein [Nocardioides lianchengensis]|uniref:Uncharacterized protein n=1 Tax=Nocardioides lianchengensis TaxID=1045774 RepID=A0A1G6LR38_9ACTN|nr:YfbU family protein [Nocardioides lianchengensis]NYG12471.1 hypothetical protein [Nocardioides lianchengensis]SDC45659.1 hypothetical protein SAMN05421872_102333 [Nocardioides lianchengensis]
MPPLTIRVDDATRRALEELAASQRTNVSDLLRSQINSLLGREEEVGGRPAPVGLTKLQRQLLVQNHEILAKLSKDRHDIEYHESMIEVLQRGYTLEYEKEFGGIWEELSPENCRIVMDILDMFRVCGAAVEKLTKKERETLGEDNLRELSFGGFDGNDSVEIHMLGYVRHLVATGRWGEVSTRIDDKHDGGNSHAPMLVSYRRMVVTYRAVLKERREAGGGFSSVYDFSLDDLERIAKSA